MREMSINHELCHSPIWYWYFQFYSPRKSCKSENITVLPGSVQCGVGGEDSFVLLQGLYIFSAVGEGAITGSLPPPTNSLCKLFTNLQ